MLEGNFMFTNIYKMQWIQSKLYSIKKK